MAAIVTQREILHAHFFCGLGGGARGFNAGQARVGSVEAKFRCIGGIDVDAASIRDFERLAGVPGTVLDLFSLEQYLAFHGKPPPAGWREAGVDDVRRAFGYEFPHIVFLSAPCKGFSGLLAEKQSKTDKYQALNGLTLRGMMLMCEAFKDDPPELIIFENVPRIATRGRHLVDQINGLLRGYGYAVAETTHNCGELGGLSQSRERFLLVARYTPKVPNFLYEPPKRPLRGVGEVLDRMPLPGDPRGGPMHRVPALQWKTWVRLAFVEAGKDWRSLNSLRVEDGYLKDFAIAPETDWRRGALGVTAWEDHSGLITANGRPAAGSFNVADPRGEMWGGGQAGVTAWGEHASTVTSARSPLQNRGAVADPRVHTGHPKSVQLGVRKWDKPAPVIKGDVSVGTGPYAVSDPRFGDRTPFNNVFRIVPVDQVAPAVAGPGGTGLCVADPRGAENRHVNGKYRVTPYDGPANSVIAASTTGNGASVVADPRVTAQHDGNLGVLDFGDPAGTVKAQAEVTTGRFAVADPREVGRHHGVSGVVAWEGPAGVVQGSSRPSNGPFAVADPRPVGTPDEQHGKYPITAYEDPARAVIGGRDNGAFAVADPRLEEKPRFSNVCHVVGADETAPAVTSAKGSLAAVADPRPTHGPNAHTNKHKVVSYDAEAPTVTGSDRVGSGALSVADPRPHGLAKNGRGTDPVNGVMYVDHYGVIGWDEHSKAVSGSAGIDNGRWAVADRRVDLLPGLAEQLVCIIIARDNTWHRPFTTLELAALQSLYDPDDALELDGRSDSAWRERIGNAVPSAAAQAIASVMGKTLLMAWQGESFSLSSEPIWVQPLAIALSVDLGGQVPA